MENTVFCLLLENKILNIVTNQAKPSVQLIIEYMKRIIAKFEMIIAKGIDVYR